MGKSNTDKQNPVPESNQTQTSGDAPPSPETLTQEPPSTGGPSTETGDPVTTDPQASAPPSGSAETPEVEEVAVEAEVVDPPESAEPEVDTEGASAAEGGETLPEEPDWKDLYLRLAAEFDNFKRRTQREKEELARFANEELLRVFMPLLDDFHRALEAMEKSDDVESLKTGVFQIHRKFNHALEKQGVTPIPARGEVFDSDFHEAIAKIPVQDEDQKGRIMDEVERGYIYHGKVIRYAKVVVGE